MPIERCILCGSNDLALALDLGMHPLADTFLKSDDFREESRYPLKLNHCLACGHVQTVFAVSARERYQENDYSYDSGNSPVSRKHFDDMAADIVKRLALTKKDLVVDIGSSVGTLLAAFKERSGADILGVEPAANIALLAVKNGVPTVQDFFGTRATEEILKRGQAKAITMTNAFNHIEDLDGFMKNISRVLAQDGQFVIEVPYLLTLVERTAFDTAYLEHISYFAVKPLRPFFLRHGLIILEAITDDYMGGSIRLCVGKGNESSHVAEFVQKEEAAGLYDAECYRALAVRVEKLKTDLVHQLAEVRAKGGRVIGVGAATKGNTLLNYCGIDEKTLEFITDSSPLKIGKFTPGSHILIKSDEAITKEITHALILPWNIAPFLQDKLSKKYPWLSYIIPHVGV